MAHGSLPSGTPRVSTNTVSHQSKGPLIAKCEGLCSPLCLTVRRRRTCPRKW